jgi:hypothetical protein
MIYFTHYTKNILYRHIIKVERKRNKHFYYMGTIHRFSWNDTIYALTYECLMRLSRSGKTIEQFESILITSLMILP